MNQADDSMTLVGVPKHVGALRARKEHSEKLVADRAPKTRLVVTRIGTAAEAQLKDDCLPGFLSDWIPRDDNHPT